MVIISSIIICTSIISILVFLLLFAEKKLLPQGDVTILINNNKDKSPIIKPGNTLLSSLANYNIFIPSACGGGGTCSQCKCKVIEGGGEILPTEKPHFSRTEIKENYRLACRLSKARYEN